MASAGQSCNARGLLHDGLLVGDVVGKVADELVFSGQRESPGTVQHAEAIPALGHEVDDRHAIFLGRSQRGAAHYHFSDAFALSSSEAPRAASFSTGVIFEADTGYLCKSTEQPWVSITEARNRVFQGIQQLRTAQL